MIHLAGASGTPESEYRFTEARDWRLDYAWPDCRVAVEIEGGAWTGGRHTRGRGFIEDCKKYNSVQLLGWTLLRYTPCMLDGDPVGIAQEIAAAILAARRAGPRQ